MKVEITKVEDSSEGTRVAFASEHGAASARWSGPAPAVGQTYHVELSATAPLTWGEQIAPSTAGQAHIAAHGRGVTLDGTLEMHDAGDGATTLRIGKSIVMLETRGAAPPLGTPVRAQIETLVLSDSGL